MHGTVTIPALPIRSCLTWPGLILLTSLAACGHGGGDELRFYAPLPGTLAIGEHQPVAELEDQRRAYLTVRSQGTVRCGVHLDDARLGATPLVGRAVAVGRRTITLSCARGGDFSRTVVLFSNRTTELTFRVPDFRAVDPGRGMAAKTVRLYAAETPG